ncbi:lysozyme-like protein [Phellopilus nigrolimitatus]|nr:lysozyme-like protein [Phellopilus nigrolimitatus]
MSPLRSLTALILGCLLTLNVQASLFHDKSAGSHVDAHHRLLQRRGSAPAPAAPVSVAKSRRDGNGSKRCKARSVTSRSRRLDRTAVATTRLPTTPLRLRAATSVRRVSSHDFLRRDITAISGPNGNLWWLNCNLESSGWDPVFVRVSDLVTADLNKAAWEDNSPFKACHDFIGLFEQFGNQYNIPPIMLASFAMQESTCNPNTVGGAGEQGLMQLTSDKCNGAPGGNCKDPAFNIEAGAKYFSSSLKANNDNVLLTIGQYNGWSKGMTMNQATSAAQTGCCRCQNNLDYLHQFVNGWLQNIDAYTNTPPLGKFFNLNQCS